MRGGSARLLGVVRAGRQSGVALRSLRVSVPARTWQPPARKQGPPEQSVRPHKQESDESHTSKWQDANRPSPMQMVHEVEPMAVAGNLTRCWGGGDFRLGHPVEYIKLDDCDYTNPAVCKYCGLRYYHVDAHH